MDVHEAPLHVMVGSVAWVSGFHRFHQLSVVPAYRVDSFAGARMLREHFEHGAEKKCTRAVSAAPGIFHSSIPFFAYRRVRGFMPCLSRGRGK